MMPSSSFELYVTFDHYNFVYPIIIALIKN